MPEVRRGSRHASDPSLSTVNNPARSATFPPTAENAIPNQSANDTRPPNPRQGTSEQNRRKSLAYLQRPEADAYFDSRAATQREYKRRAKTLKEYYEDNPHLLPQLPFTFRHGTKRWRLAGLLFMMFVDACAVPIALYYGMHYSGHVEGWIIFAIVTTIWGGPAYFEFGIRTLRLIKKGNFYRPLGTESRWACDITNWTTVITVTVVTALFIIGSAPHIVWLRVLCMPAPAILYCVGGCILLMQFYKEMKWPAPFRVSSTAKGEQLEHAAYYFLEDVMAVNAKAGRPYREALAARNAASPRFRKMLRWQSWFWAVPPIIVAIPLTVIAVIDEVPPTAAYGICWAIPFLFMVVWGLLSMVRAKKELHLEREEWENDNGEHSVADGKFSHHKEKEEALPGSADGSTTNGAANGTINGTVHGSHDSSTLNGEPDLEAGRNKPVERSTQ